MGQVTGHALVNDLGHGAAPIGDNRGTARHRLHDRQAEGLIEMDRVQQRRRIPEDFCPALRADRADEYDLVPVYVRLYGIGEIGFVLYDAADHQPSPRAAGDLDRVGSSLIRMDAPERDKAFPGGGTVLEHPEVDAMMERRGILKPGVAVGI